MAKHHRVAILMGQDLGYCRQVLGGIQAYAATQSGWVFRDGPPDVRVVDAIRDWAPHGIIAHLFDPSLCEALKELGKPVVNTTNTLEDCPFPLVEVDHLRVGEMAAAHLLQRGFRQFSGQSPREFRKGVSVAA
jgi:LacI family transcriptional regulator